MTKLLKSIVLVAFCASPAFSTDDITVDRATNIFNTEVSAASTTMRAVRVGRINTVPSVVFNQPNYAPVILDAVDGVLRYNGTSLTTETFTGTDMAISNDLSVGRDSAITRNETVGGTLDVTGATSLSTLGASGASTLVGAVYMGAAGSKSTAAANGVITAGASLVATTSVSAGTSVAAGTTVSAGTTVTGGTGLISTAGPITLYSRTMAQLLGMTPTANGQMYYCSDCTRKVVVSTGTTQGNFSGAEGGKFE